jgi:hypothetical protein
MIISSRLEISRIISSRMIPSRIIYSSLISRRKILGLGGRPWVAGGALEGGGRGRARAGWGYAESPR